ncbi:S-adenosyl-L-methionine-dependent methyltransferase, partial [Mycena sp. CBHHK59/15]
RLNALHLALKTHLGGKLCLAPLHDAAPRRIIDLGCGTGAWAIQAAGEFREAHVVAVDLLPLPPKELPANIEFQVLDLTAAFPFEEGTFDVVHARGVMMHLPNGHDTVLRATRLVKPGGWLLLDEFDTSSIVDTAGPATALLVAKFTEIMHARGADPTIGGKLEGILRGASLFTQVNVRRLECPLNGSGQIFLLLLLECGSNNALNRLGNLHGRVIQRTVKEMADNLPSRFAAQGLTEDVADRCRDELYGASGDVAGSGNIYLTWSQWME